MLEFLPRCLYCNGRHCTCRCLRSSCAWSVECFALSDCVGPHVVVTRLAHPRTRSAHYSPAPLVAAMGVVIFATLSVCSSVAVPSSSASLLLRRRPAHAIALAQKSCPCVCVCEVHPSSREIPRVGRHILRQPRYTGKALRAPRTREARERESLRKSAALDDEHRRWAVSVDVLRPCRRLRFLDAIALGPGLAAVPQLLAGVRRVAAGPWTLE